jgi:hypothetical protein
MAERELDMHPSIATRWMVLGRRTRDPHALQQTSHTWRDVGGVMVFEIEWLCAGLRWVCGWLHHCEGNGTAADNL